MTRQEARSAQVIASGELRELATGGYNLAISAKESGASWEIGILPGKKRTLRLELPGLIAIPVPLKQSHVDGPGGKAPRIKCFANRENIVESTVRICFNGTELTIDVAQTDDGVNYSFVFNRDSQDLIQPETPAEYSLDELVTAAISKNYATRIEFERVVQAKLLAQNARLSLLPHAGFSTLLGFISFNMMTLVRSVGDLAPFLLPTRWLRAAEAKHQHEAEYEAWLLMKADAGNIAEGLVYAATRDATAIEIIRANREAIERIRDEFWARERIGLLPEGATDEMNSVLNSVDQAILGLTYVLTAEYRALAQASGFMNPDAVAGISSLGDLGFRSAQPVETVTLQPLVLTRSLELRQLDSLIKAARLNRVERYFAWLDPAGGEGSGAIGAGIFPYLAVGASKIRELQLRRQQLQETLLQKLATAASESNNALSANELARRGAELQVRRVNRIMQELRLGMSISLTALTQALQEKVRADLDVVNSEYAWYVAESKLTRLLFVGPYAELATGRPEGAGRGNLE